MKAPIQDPPAHNTPSAPRPFSSRNGRRRSFIRLVKNPNYHVKVSPISTSLLARDSDAAARRSRTKTGQGRRAAGRARWKFDVPRLSIAQNHLRHGAGWEFSSRIPGSGSKPLRANREKEIRQERCLRSINHGQDVVGRPPARSGPGPSGRRSSILTSSVRNTITIRPQATALLQEPATTARKLRMCPCPMSDMAALGGDG